MADFPERIWASSYAGDDGAGRWESAANRPWMVEYVRADLCSVPVAGLEVLAEGLERLIESYDIEPEEAVLIARVQSVLCGAPGGARRGVA